MSLSFYNRNRLQIASPACTELEVVMLDWLGQMIGLPDEFLARSGGEAGGVIQGTASEATLVALLGAKARVMQRVKEQHPEWTEFEILSKLVGYCNSKCDCIIYLHIFNRFYEGRCFPYLWDTIYR